MKVALFSKCLEASYLFRYYEIPFVGHMKGEQRMREIKEMPKGTDYKDGGNFKVKLGNTTFTVGVYFNDQKKQTLEDRMKELIHKDVEAGNF